MKNFTLFIADLHLHEYSQNKITKFINLFATIAPKADAVYILGDFFEIWLGEDVFPTLNDTIKTTLNNFAKTNIPVYILPGNRDFLLNSKFVAQLNCILLKNPHKTNLYGIPTLLTHGDILCTNDLWHTWFRKLIINNSFNQYFLKIPRMLRKFIGTSIAKICSKTKKIKQNKTKFVVKKTVLNYLQQYDATQIIHGHIHVSEHENIRISNKLGKRIVVGAWTEENCDVLIYYNDHEFKYNHN